MKKNMTSSLKSIQKKTFLLDTSSGKKIIFSDGIIHSNHLLSLTKLSKKIIDTPLIKSKKILLEKLDNEQKKHQSIYFKIKKHRWDNYFKIETSLLGKKFYDALTTDLKKLTSYFAHHKFNPYLDAFINAKKMMKQHFNLGDNFYFIENNLSHPMSLEEAKLVWRICHQVIKLMKNFYGEIGFIAAVNDFDKPVRQNAKRLKDYLIKLEKKHPRMMLIQQNITLADSINFSESEARKAAHEAEIFKHSRLHIDPSLLPSNQTLNPNHALYKTLQNARTAHIKNIQKHSVLGDAFAGYVWKLNYNGFSSWSYDLAIFFDSASQPNLRESYLHTTCNQLWLQLCKRAHTVQQGVASLTPSPDQTSALPTGKNGYTERMQELVSRLIRTDYLLRVTPPDKGRIFGKGQIPK